MTPDQIEAGKIISLNLQAALKEKGLPQKALPFLMLQSAVESAGYTSKVYRTDNNVTGIKYSQNGYGSVGTKSPEGDNYAHYDSLKSWAKDFIRILNRDGALAANSIDEYAAILKKGGYFGATLDEYKIALHSWVASFRKWLPMSFGADAQQLTLFAVIVLLLTIITYLQ